MPEAHRRQKQPELIKAQLLTVVRELLVQEGPHAVTLDAVAQRANVTKGGLQHHYRSKQALLDALADQLLEEFQASFEAALALEPDTAGRHARAYVRTSFDAGSTCNNVETQRAIGLLALTSPRCRDRWHETMKTALAADGDDPQTATRLMACRLAGDGFWFAQMLDTYDMNEQRRADILQFLLQLCDGGPHP